MSETSCVSCLSESFRIDFDAVSDFIPGWSTITNVTNVYQLCNRSAAPEQAPSLEDRYFKHLSSKSALVLFFLCVPIINIFAAFYFHVIRDNSTVEPTPKEPVKEQGVKEETEVTVREILTSEVKVDSKWKKHIELVNEFLEPTGKTFDELALYQDRVAEKTNFMRERIDPFKMKNSLERGVFNNGKPYLLMKVQKRNEKTCSVAVLIPRNKRLEWRTFCSSTRLIVDSEKAAQSLFRGEHYDRLALCAVGLFKDEKA